MNSLFFFLASQPKAMQAIENAMNEWSSVSCIRFIRRTTEQSYIEFFKGKGYVKFYQY